MQNSVTPVRVIVKNQFLRWRLRQVSRLYGVNGFGLIEAELDSVAWMMGEIQWKRLRCIGKDGNDIDYSGGDSCLHQPILELPSPLKGEKLALWIWPFSQEMLLGRVWGQGFKEPFGTDGGICVYRWIGDGKNWLLDPTHFPEVVRLNASEHWIQALQEMQKVAPESELSKAVPWLLEAEPLECWRECVRYCLGRGLAMEELPRFHRNQHGDWMERMLELIRRIS